MVCTAFTAIIACFIEATSAVCAAIMVLTASVAIVACFIFGTSGIYTAIMVITALFAIRARPGFIASRPITRTSTRYAAIILTCTTNARFAVLSAS